VSTLSDIDTDTACLIYSPITNAILEVDNKSSVIRPFFDLGSIADSIWFTYNCGHTQDGQLVLEGIKRISADSVLLLKYQDNLWIQVNRKTKEFDTLHTLNSDNVTFFCHPGFGVLSGPKGGYFVMALPNSQNFFSKPMIAYVTRVNGKMQLEKRLINLPEVYRKRPYPLSWLASATMMNDSLVVNFSLDSNFYVYDVGTENLSMVSTDYSFKLNDNTASTSFEQKITHVKSLVYHERNNELVRVIQDSRDFNAPTAILEFFSDKLEKKGEIEISLEDYWYRPIPYGINYLLLKNKKYPNGDSLYFDEVQFE
jgi:hypothetical protein